MKRKQSKEKRLIALVQEALTCGSFRTNNPEWVKQALEITEGYFVPPCSCRYLPDSEGSVRAKATVLYSGCVIGGKDDCQIHGLAQAAA